MNWILKFCKENGILILAFAILTVGVLLVIAMPYILTQWTIGVPFGERTGQIGDSIGGTTAPVIGLLSAALIFLSFYVQYKFNKQQDKRIEAVEGRESERIVYDELKDLSKFITEFSYFTSSSSGINSECFGHIAWQLLVQDIESGIYRNRQQNKFNWLDLPKAIYLMKLYGLFSIVAERVAELKGEHRTRMLILLRSETALLHKFFEVMGQTKGLDENFREFTSNFVSYVQKINDMDK